MLALTLLYVLSNYFIIVILGCMLWFYIKKSTRILNSTDESRINRHMTRNIIVHVCFQRFYLEFCTFTWNFTLDHFTGSFRHNLCICSDHHAGIAQLRKFHGASRGDKCVQNCRRVLFTCVKSNRDNSYR